MADELDKLVLVQLREIHATLAEHTVRFGQIEKGFDKLDKRFEDFQNLVNHALGLVTMNATKMRALEARHDASEAWRRRMDERLDRLERRLCKVEEKLHT